MIWVILFVVGFVVTTTLALRRRDRGAHVGCHGGAAWPPDDVSRRGERATRHALVETAPAEPLADGWPERELAGTAVDKREMVGAGGER